MKRRASALLLAIAATGLLAACESTEVPVGDEPIDDPGASGQQSTSSLAASLDAIDCEGRTSASADEPGMLQAGECVPFAGVEPVEYYEFESDGDAELWAADAQVAAVDGIYRDGPVIIIDRNNDYLLQLAAQFEPAI
ncbi:hypothetical protein [Agrococcus casei]|uniref:hypothetical protein n=1 Tax=Agrococcus casei TaxID=343512 RepID=UPI003F92303D